MVVLAALFTCVSPRALAGARAKSLPSPEKATSAALLDRAYAIKTKNYEAFLHTLKLLHQRHDQLSKTQRWQLRYLDAWKIAFEGDYARSNKILHEIIANSGDISTSAQASALLIYTLNADQKYEAAYKVASGLLTELSKIQDHRTRIIVLTQIAQMLALAGQHDLALKYARQVEAELPPGSNKCKAYGLEVGVQVDSNTLDASAPTLKRAIDACLAAGQIVYANVLRIDLSNMLIDEGHPRQAIDLLHRIAPSILKSGYQRHVVELHALLAKAYLKKGEDAKARKSALMALAPAHADNFTEDVSIAYNVLYHVEKNAGRDADALVNYEKFVALDQASWKATEARALAYQMAKQEVLAKKLKLDALSKQNRILQLRQSLDHKAAETNRLYALLLLFVLGFIVFWLYRTKHSQLHFRKLARHDGLTGAFNRQHFLEQAERTLQRLRRTSTLACLLVLDMDHFKRVNDTFGHVAGDEVLKHAAGICQAELRSSDVFGRLGGEEFGILMPGCSPGQGMEIGERICAVMAKSPARLENGDKVSVTSSIGIACTDTSGYVLKQLLIDADAALYEAKHAGRNRVSARIDGDAEGLF